MKKRTKTNPLFATVLQHKDIVYGKNQKRPYVMKMLHDDTKKNLDHLSIDQHYMPGCATMSPWHVTYHVQKDQNIYKSHLYLDGSGQVIHEQSTFTHITNHQTKNISPNTKNKHQQRAIRVARPIMAALLSTHQTRTETLAKKLAQHTKSLHAAQRRKAAPAEIKNILDQCITLQTEYCALHFAETKEHHALNAELKALKHYQHHLEKQLHAVDAKPIKPASSPQASIEAMLTQIDSQTCTHRRRRRLRTALNKALQKLKGTTQFQWLRHQVQAKTIVLKDWIADQTIRSWQALLAIDPLKENRPSAMNLIKSLATLSIPKAPKLHTPKVKKTKASPQKPSPPWQQPKRRQARTARRKIRFMR